MDAAAELRTACPELMVRTDPTLLDAASVDALRPFRGREVVRRANRTGVLRGGSGLVSDAASIASSVIVSLARLDAVTVDPNSCLVRAGAGAMKRASSCAWSAHWSRT